ncbi:unnamed protein product [Ixodes pacificus]
MFTESSYILFIITVVCHLPQCGHIVQVLYPCRLRCDWLKGSCEKKRKEIKVYFLFRFFKVEFYKCEIWCLCRVYHKSFVFYRLKRLAFSFLWRDPFKLRDLYRFCFTPVI